MADWSAHRLNELPPYLFVAIDRKKRQAMDAGKDVINLGIGDPDRPTPEFIIDRMAQAIRKPANHRYPIGGGTAEFRKACAAFVLRRFGVDLNPDTQVLALIGSKEGLGHLPLATVNPGETVLVPQPGYPVYTSATLFAGGRVHPLPLTARSGWLPDLGSVPKDVARSAKLMFLNYPNNPTGAVADLDFYRDVVAFGRRHDILIAHDAAYCELYFDDQPPSILEVDGAMDCAVEFHSLSKTFNMTGWRIAFAVGQPEVLAALAKVKDNVDSGPFGATQEAAIEALNNSAGPEARSLVETYRGRRDQVVEALVQMGIDVERPRAGFYVWAKCPPGYTSMDFVTRLLDEAAVVVVPGSGFGAGGEGYFRIALTVDADRMRQALDRMGHVQW